MSVIEIPHVFAQQLELIFLLSISIWLVKPQLCSTQKVFQPPTSCNGNHQFLWIIYQTNKNRNPKISLLHPWKPKIWNSRNKWLPVATRIDDFPAFRQPGGRTWNFPMPQMGQVIRNSVNGGDPGCFKNTATQLSTKHSWLETRHF